MSSVQLRLPLGLGQRLHQTVFERGKHEFVAFCLVSHVEIGGTATLLVRHVLGLDEGEYLKDALHGASWRGTAMLPAIERAIGEGLGIVVVHAHDFAGRVHLSGDDLRSAQRLVPMFQARVPGRPHGSLVLGRGAAAGFIALPGEAARLVENVRVRWMGKAMVDWPGEPASDRPDDVFDRQALVVGNQGSLKARRVAVVGLCGGGTHFVQQLAHAGVGTIIGIDDDQCSMPNLHRGVGMRLRDGRTRRPKTEVMARLVKTIGTGVKFIGVEDRVPHPKAVDALKSADVIVGSVDNLHARADLQEIAWRNVIPYVDVGVSIRGLKGPASAPRASIGGNVHVFIPGGFCGWCCGFVSDEKLRMERDGRDDRSYFQNRKGDAQVVSFNGVVASQGVSEVIQLLSAYRGSSFDPADLVADEGQQRGVLKFHGGRGTLEEWGASRKADCPVCNGLLGAGTVLWRRAS